MTDKSILHDLVREALDTAGAEYEVLACEPHLADTAEFCAHYGISPEEACNAILVAGTAATAHQDDEIGTETVTTQRDRNGREVVTGKVVTRRARSGSAVS